MMQVPASPTSISQHSHWKDIANNRRSVPGLQFWTQFAAGWPDEKPYIFSARLAVPLNTLAC